MAKALALALLHLCAAHGLVLSVGPGLIKEKLTSVASLKDVSEDELVDECGVSRDDARYFYAQFLANGFGSLELDPGLAVEQFELAANAGHCGAMCVEMRRMRYRTRSGLGAGCAARARNDCILSCSFER